MREDPGFDSARIADCLRANYALETASIRFLPLGYDLSATVFEVVAADGTSYFLKIRSGPINESSLLVPRALLDRGISHVLAPLRTRSGALWSSLDEQSVILYPFIRGENAMDAGLSDRQWREFGATLQAVHASGVAEQFRDRLPVESFAIPSAAVVQELFAEIGGMKFESVAATSFAAFWQENAEPIQRLLARAEELGAELRAKPFEHVLCHADIHAANILVDEAGQIYLVDWDGPIIAPRERDLLFVVGSKIAREVTPREEALFFAGYGSVEIDPDALSYYRYERIIEDLGELGQSVFLDAHLGEPMREEAAALAMGFFEPGGMIESVETVTPYQSPTFL